MSMRPWSNRARRGFIASTATINACCGSKSKPGPRGAACGDYPTPSRLGTGENPEKAKKMRCYQKRKEARDVSRTNAPARRCAIARRRGFTWKRAGYPGWIETGTGFLASRFAVKRRSENRPGCSPVARNPVAWWYRMRKSNSSSLRFP